MIFVRIELWVLMAASFYFLVFISVRFCMFLLFLYTFYCLTFEPDPDFLDFNFKIKI